ncbi:ribbon-helix-helix domain-containing protein [Halalkalicoccus jeotgali]|uniref:Uncharacterized protein n=2 Tax=Halalkalicoccus jeotgali (strain DSM 18796 / CECT 7217 / JCM 14584 / KCTC 4019 / B3) TaxID=795797 RepID=D8JD99_HALJB|nr:hypothetical protein [Halalkalicoccus jeotgali]ADJ17252.1 hypothetical protein HacjB3_19583 [Halalkalicoccus jeotgali B3]
MRQMTVSLREEQARWVESKVGDSSDHQSKSAVIRFIIDDHQDRNEELVELQRKREELENKVQRLQNEKKLILQQREEHTELVESIQREQTMAERKNKAGVATRFKWWLTGMPDE